MQGVAHIMLAGNLTGPAESRSTNSGTSVLSFTVAVNGRKDQNGNQNVCYYRVSYFGNHDNFAPYLQKGQAVMVVGDLDAKLATGNDGRQFMNLNVRANNVVLCGNRDDNGGQNNAYQPQAQPQQYAQQYQAQAPQVQQYQPQQSAQLAQQVTAQVPYQPQGQQYQPPQGAPMQYAPPAQPGQTGQPGAHFTPVQVDDLPF